jgi:ABC-type multidrug transport system ATPase subunit
MTASSSIELRRVSRLFRDEPALVGIDLEVGNGEVVWVRGPNGAGKSTLLRLCATAIAPTFGALRILGLDARSERSAIRSRTELIGHHTRLYGDATPREHLGFVARLHGLSAADVDRALGSFDLLGLSRRRNRGLSFGQRQRVALARAALRRPELLLLDEPYGSLDVTNRDAVDALVADAHARGTTVILATHDVERAVLVADRVVDLAAGRLVGDARNAPVTPIPIREVVG